MGYLHQKKLIILNKLPLDLAAKLALFLSSDKIDSIARKVGCVRRSSPVDGHYLFTLFTLLGNDRRFHSSLDEMTRFAHEELGKPLVTKQSFDERLTSQAVDFMAAMYIEARKAMFQKLQQKQAIKHHPMIKRILIGDTTKFTLPTCMADDFPGCGGRGSASKAGLSLFYEFDLLSTYWDATWADGKTNDKAFNDLDHVQAADLILRDLGFRDLLFWAQVKNKGAFFIQRFFSPTKLRVIEQDKVGPPIDIASFAKQYIEKAMKSDKDYCGFQVQLGTNAATRAALGTVRLVVFKIPQEKALAKIEHARKEAVRNNRKFTKAEEVLCRYQICITNLPEEEYPDADIVALYRLRWQVELRFKSWKSRLGVGETVVKQHKNRLLCQMWGFLLYQLIFVTMAEVIQEQTEQSINEPKNGVAKATNKHLEGQQDKQQEMVAPIQLSFAKGVQLLASNHIKLVQAFAKSPQEFVRVLTNLFDEARIRLRLDHKKPPKQKKNGEQQQKKPPKIGQRRANNYKQPNTQRYRKVKDQRV